MSSGDFVGCESFGRVIVNSAPCFGTLFTGIVPP